MGQESRIELWSPLDRRSALLVSELTGFVANKRWKPPVEKTQTAGPQCTPTEHMVRQVKTHLVRSSGLRSEKNSSRRGVVFLDFYLYRTSQERAVKFKDGFQSESKIGVCVT
jgi:hypothetical protein